MSNNNNNNNNLEIFTQIPIKNLANNQRFEFMDGNKRRVVHRNQFKKWVELNPTSPWTRLPLNQNVISRLNVENPNTRLRRNIQTLQGRLRQLETRMSTNNNRRVLNSQLMNLTMQFFNLRELNTNRSLNRELQNTYSTIKRLRRSIRRSEKTKEN